ncbi:MAG: methanogenesis marker 3 protein [Archaeoglobales archaeon]|nr:methanogenesis marker 3 protein [Archaeoglobales archaeon]
MMVKLDGETLEIPEGATFGDLLKIRQLSTDHVSAIVRGKMELETLPEKYQIYTTRGKITIRVENQELWKLVMEKLIGLEVAWRTKRALAFGPFNLDLKNFLVTQTYEPGQFLISFAGGSSESVYIIATITKYSAKHNTTDGGVVAKIVGGIKVLRSLEIGDKFLRIEPVVETRFLEGKILRAELEEKLKDGDEIYTKMVLELDCNLSEAAEYVMSVFEEKNIVEEVTNTYVRIKGLKGLEFRDENVEKRERGVVSIRTTGKNKGDVYIYRKSRMPNKDHLIAGRIVQGMEIMEVVKKGDSLRVETIPARINTVGLKQSEAQSLLEKIGIRQIREGDKSDEAVVVSQYPLNTAEILAKREVKTVGVEKSKIVRLKLYYDLAPRTTEYFKLVAGMVGRRVGKLEVYFKTNDLIIFRPKSSYKDPLIPENTPKEIVKAGEIGVTNMSRRHAGLIGVRFSDSKEYGPTAERFESTNIIGVVVENFEALKDAKEGSEVYFMEV